MCEVTGAHRKHGYWLIYRRLIYISKVEPIETILLIYLQGVLHTHPQSEGANDRKWIWTVPLWVMCFAADRSVWPNEHLTPAVSASFRLCPVKHHCLEQRTKEGSVLQVTVGLFGHFRPTHPNPSVRGAVICVRCCTGILIRPAYLVLHTTAQSTRRVITRL